MLGGAALTAAASTFLDLGPGAQNAFALYNKDLDIPITDPVQAVATVFGGGNKKGGGDVCCVRGDEGKRKLVIINSLSSTKLSLRFFSALLDELRLQRRRSLATPVN